MMLWSTVRLTRARQLVWIRYECNGSKPVITVPDIGDQIHIIRMTFSYFELVHYQDVLPAI